MKNVWIFELLQFYISKASWTAYSACCWLVWWLTVWQSLSLSLYLWCMLWLVADTTWNQTILSLLMLVI